MMRYITQVISLIENEQMKKDVRRYLFVKNMESTGGYTQTGGGKQYKKKLLYDNHTFRIIVHIHKYKNSSKNYIQIAVLPNKLNCGFINIMEGSGEAELQGFGAKSYCAFPDLPEKGAGTIMMNFMLDFLRHSKHEYNIKKVVLTDNSYLPCANCPARVPLSDLYILMEGTTWYGKFGFIPTENNNEGYEENIEIMKSATTDDLNITEIIDKILEKASVHNKEMLIENKKYLIKKFSKKRPLKTIFREISSHNCCLLKPLFITIFRNLGLTTMYGKDFYLEL